MSNWHRRAELLVAFVAFGALGMPHARAFDLPTTADGYDVIETVARQAWGRGGRVGLISISFSDISQLFVAGARAIPAGSWSRSGCVLRITGQIHYSSFIR